MKTYHLTHSLLNLFLLHQFSNPYKKAYDMLRTYETEGAEKGPDEDI